uniref:Rab GTPase n=1 Tax=Rhabditophanes sp. KR3021 TaxID=114890 RepID=A0AC35U5N6_9BILA
MDCIIINAEDDTNSKFDNDEAFITAEEQARLLHEQALRIYALCDIGNKGFTVPNELEHLSGVINFTADECLAHLFNFDHPNPDAHLEKLSQKEFIKKIKTLLLKKFDSKRTFFVHSTSRDSSDIESDMISTKKVLYYLSDTSTGLSESEMKEIKIVDSSEEDNIDKLIGFSDNIQLHIEHPTYYKKYPTSPGETSLFDEINETSNNNIGPKEDVRSNNKITNNFLAKHKYTDSHQHNSSFSNIFSTPQLLSSNNITTSSANDVRSIKADERIFKIVFVGDSSVGKTCFLQRYCYNQFKQAFNATIGVDFTVKTINVNDKKMTIQLWDTAGQERYRAITKQYFRKASAVVLMYDVTSERSFVNVRNWIESVRRGVEEKCVICLIGNKVDLCSAEVNRAVTFKDGKSLAEEFDMNFYETSAYTKFNVNECIDNVCGLLQMQEQREIEKALKLESKSNKFGGSWCCV